MEGYAKRLGGAVAYDLWILLFPKKVYFVERDVPA